MRLRYTLPALADLASILDYVADRSPQGAARIHMRIRTVTDLLLRYPLAGALTDEPTIRRIATTPYPYLIFYEATDSENLRRAALELRFPRCDLIGVNVEMLGQLNDRPIALDGSQGHLRLEGR